MGVYDELGVTPLINGVGTYTVVGATRMSEETLRDLCEAAGQFVEIEALQAAIHPRVAELTHNESAFLCNSCSTAIYLAVAACVEKHYHRDFNQLDIDDVHRCEVVALWGQHIPYDHAIEQLGPRIHFVGFPNMEAAMEDGVVEAAIGEHTVCGYFAPRTPYGTYGEECMNLERFLDICHRHGIPVLVDAAAQLPPKANLWRFTRDMGAEMACFSGGKDLAGPQASGLLVGQKDCLEVVTRLGFPHYGCGRLMKIGREEIVALYSAIKQYMAADEDARLAWCEEQVVKLQQALKDAKHLEATRCWPNQAGQPLPRAFVALKNTEVTPSEFRQRLKEGRPSIICYSENRPGVYVNPMCLKEGEMELIAERILELDKGL